jgi:hypothetical protein
MVLEPVFERHEKRRITLLRFGRRNRRCAARSRAASRPTSL